MGLFGKLFGGADKGPANGKPADAKEEPLYKIGPGTGLGYADSRAVSLADGSPLSYDLLVSENPAGVLMPAEAQRAKSLLAAILASEDPKVIEAVNSCRGKTREQARAILKDISGTGNDATEEEAA